MKQRLYIRTGVACIYGVFLCCCSTPDATKVPPPVIPEFMQVLHPGGTDLGDLSSIFLDTSAPQDPLFLKNCDSDFRKLKSLTVSIDELTAGVRELVKQDPVRYHWCFYGKVRDLETFLAGDSYVDERQKEVLHTYEFLVPVARAFSTEFHDSRYLRWAVSRYQKFSEWVFYRKLELTPVGTMDLVQMSNPFGLVRDTPKAVSVLDKYHLAQRVPAAAPTGIPTGLPTGLPTELPTDLPTALPTEVPTQTPSGLPTDLPTALPSGASLENIPETAPQPNAETAIPKLPENSKN